MLLIKLFTCTILLHIAVGGITDDDNCEPITTKSGLATMLLNKTLSNKCLRILVDQTLTEPIERCNVHNLTITGLSIVTCEEDVGISFENSSTISFSDLTFDGCGGKFNSTSSPPSGSDINPYISTTLYFKESMNIAMNSIKIVNSFGYGIVMYDCGGILNFNKLSVTHGKAKNYTTTSGSTTNIWLGYSSGGGVYIEYTRSGKPNYLNGNQVNFAECVFRSNHGEFVPSPVPENSTQHVPFGRGGAISLFFLGKTIHNDVTITDINAIYNEALWGGSVYIEFSKYSKSNKINFSDYGSIQHNHAYFSGGGIRLQMYAHKAEERNNVMLESMFFVGNTAQVGGSFSQHQESKHKASETTEVIFRTCMFQESVAKLGAAIYLDSVSVLFENVTIKENAVTDRYTDGVDTYSLLGFGALYAYRSNIRMIGTNKVHYNNNTAFLLDYSNLIVDGSLRFRENRGGYGGAIALYQHSQIILSDKTMLVFQNNVANKGGALFAKVPGPPLPLWDTHKLSVYPCFFQRDSKNFKGKVEFIENIATKNDGNAIFATTLQNCLGDDGDSLTNVLSNWTNFNFSQNLQPIRTDAIKINISTHQWENVYAGQMFNATIRLYDERDNVISATVDVQIDSEGDVIQTDGNHSQFVVSEETINLSLIAKKQSEPFNVTISSPQGKAGYKKIPSITLSGCKFGYSFWPLPGKCICDAQENSRRGIAQCDLDGIHIYENMWANPNPKFGKYSDDIIVPCPDDYCRKCNQDSTGNEHSCIFNKSNQCAEGRSESLVCSQCDKGKSVAFGSEKCMKCSNLWILMFPVVIGCTLLVVLIILVLNVDVYDNYLNSVLFFYQVAYLLRTPTQKFDQFIKLISGVINLNGVNGYIYFCLYDGMNDMWKMFANYMIPVGMIIWLLLIIWCSDKCCSNSYFNKNKCFNAMVFIMMFSYGNITRITFNLLYPIKITVDGPKRLFIYAETKIHTGSHLYIYIFAWIAFFLIVVLFPFILLTSEFFMRFGRGARLKPILDNFNKCFKEKILAQKFSAYYFVWRLVILAVSIFYPKGQMQLSILTAICVITLLIFAMVKPYKLKDGNLKWLNLNNFDMAILANLSAVAVLSNGKRKLDLNDGMDDILYYMIRALMYPPLIVPCLCLCRWIIGKGKTCYYGCYQEEKREFDADDVNHEHHSIIHGCS